MKNNFLSNESPSGAPSFGSTGTFPLIAVIFAGSFADVDLVLYDAQNL